MDNKTNILLICDDKSLAERLAKKLVFMRVGDSVKISDYEHARRNIQILVPELLFVCEHAQKVLTLNLISDVVENDLDSSVILLVKNYDSEFILAAYDAGITDFSSIEAQNFELVIRAVNNLKLHSVKYLEQRNKKLLIQHGIIDELTGFYTARNAKCVFENEVDDNLIKSGVFIAIEPDEKSKATFSIEKFACAVKQSVRSVDLVSLAKGAKFYLFLPYELEAGALTVIEKIELNYGNGFRLKAGITEIAGKSFERIELEVLKALSEAICSKKSYVFVKEDKPATLDDWLDDENVEKNYKLFKQVFNKKLEKVIAPVFYRLQKAYEEKLFGTQIEQYTEEEQCVFLLKNRIHESCLKIVYPGFNKIVIYITHAGLDSPEDKEISLPLSKVTPKELFDIVESFIKEFKYTSID